MRACCTAVLAPRWYHGDCRRPPSYQPVTRVPAARDGTLEPVSSPTPVENRVSASSVVLLSSLMLLFFSGLLVFTFNRTLVEGTTNQWVQGSWLWWLIPLVPAVVAGTILFRRNAARQQRRQSTGGAR